MSLDSPRRDSVSLARHHSASSLVDRPAFFSVSPSGGGGGASGSFYDDQSIPMTSLPDHLRYKPMVIPNPYASVTPRYLEPRKSPAAPPPATAKSFLNASSSHVTSKYLEKRAPSPNPAPIPSYKESSFMQQHNAVAKTLGFGNADSRLLAWREKEVVSPRKAIESRKEHMRKELGWRPNTVMRSTMTFDEFRKKNAFLLKLAERKAKPAPSIVIQYIKGATGVIKHHTMGPHYVTPKRSASADQKDTRHWVDAGGAGGGVWTARKGSPRSASVTRADLFVKDFRKTASTRSVSPVHVPRVAYLSPSHTLRRWEEETLEAADELDGGTRNRSTNTPIPPPPPAAGSGGGSVLTSTRGRDSTPRSSPAPVVTSTTFESSERRQYRGSSASVARETSSTTRYELTSTGQEVEVIQGPVTLAVPPGAAVRILKA